MRFHIKLHRVGIGVGVCEGSDGVVGGGQTLDFDFGREIGVATGGAAEPLAHEGPDGDQFKLCQMVEPKADHMREGARIGLCSEVDQAGV